MYTCKYFFCTCIITVTATLLTDAKWSCIQTGRRNVPRHPSVYNHHMHRFPKNHPVQSIRRCVSARDGKAGQLPCIKGSPLKHTRQCATGKRWRMHDDWYSGLTLHLCSLLGHSMSWGISYLRAPSTAAAEAFAWASGGTWWLQLCTHIQKMPRPVLLYWSKLFTPCCCCSTCWRSALTHAFAFFFCFGCTSSILPGMFWKWSSWLLFPPNPLSTSLLVIVFDVKQPVQ